MQTRKDNFWGEPILKPSLLPLLFFCCFLSSLPLLLQPKALEVMLRDEVKPLSVSPQLAKDTNAVDNLLKISFLRNYALPLIMRDPSLYDLDAFYDHPLLSFLTAVSPNYDGYEAAFEQYDIETRQVYSGVSV
jgi:hypothetical protein